VAASVAAAGVNEPQTDRQAHSAELPICRLNVPHGSRRQQLGRLSEYGVKTPSRVRIPPSPFRSKSELFVPASHPKHGVHEGRGCNASRLRRACLWRFLTPCRCGRPGLRPVRRPGGSGRSAVQRRRPRERTAARWRGGRAPRRFRRSGAPTVNERHAKREHALNGGAERVDR
jgi:hypothetical protein